MTEIALQPSLYLGGESLRNKQNYNSSPPGQNGSHFANDIFKCVFMIKKFCILVKISLFVPKGPSIGFR